MLLKTIKSEGHVGARVDKITRVGHFGLVAVVGYKHAMEFKGLVHVQDVEKESQYGYVYGVSGPGMFFIRVKPRAP